MFTSMRCISRHKDTQVYGTILPTELTNQAMLESKAYQTYYAFSSGEKTLKPKYIRKKADSETPPKKKPVQAAKGTRLKSKAKMTKPDKKEQPAKKTKAKGLAVLFEVSLTKAKQIKLATKRTKKDFHGSHVSGSGDGVDTQSKVPDEQQQKTFGTDKGTGTIPGVPDVPPYKSESDKESWGDSEDEDNENNSDDLSDNDDDGDSDDHDDDSDDERTESDRDEIPDLKLTNVDQTEHEAEEYNDEFYEEKEDEHIDDEENIDHEEYDEVIKELYDDVNVNVGNDDTKMTDADKGSSKQQNKADEPVQSSLVSSDFTSKLLNFENPSPANNEIASLLETSAHHATVIPEITSGFTTTTPPPPSFFNPILQQQTPTSTTTISTNLIIDSTMKTIIKDQVKAQVSKIMPKIEKYVTESLGAEVLVRLTNQPQTAYTVAALLLELELKKILIDKMETNKSIDRLHIQKNLYNALVESYNSDKDIITLYGSKRRKFGKDAESSKDSRSKEKKSSNTSKDASQSKHKSSSKSVHEVTKADWFKKPERPPTPDPDWSKRQQVDFRPPQAWISQAAHAEEPPTSFDEFNDTSFVFSAFVMNRLKIPNMTQEILVKYDQHAYLGTSYWGPKRQRFYGYESNLTSSKDVYSRRRIIVVTRLKIMKMHDYGHLEEIKVHRDDHNLYTRIVIQRRVEDLQLGVESYQKKLNLTKPDTYRSNLRNKTAHTSHSDPHGMIYVDQLKRKRLIRTDELHKFNDGMLNDVQTALHDIAAGKRMEYLPMRKWSNLDKKRARVMVQDIDKQNYQRRLMRNLEKFVGVTLLERTI
ncbi:hypothetical protein Tco_0701108 [Tanacetum coccineum]